MKAIPHLDLISTAIPRNPDGLTDYSANAFLEIRVWSDKVFQE